MTKFASYMSDEAIKKDSQALLIEYALARGITIEVPIAIDDIIEKHLNIGIEFDDMHRRFGVPRPDIGIDPDILGAIFFEQKRIATDESLSPVVDTSLSGSREAYELGAIIARFGRPCMVVSENVTEFASKAILAWSKGSVVE